jgi:hypothetical protein
MPNIKQFCREGILGEFIKGNYSDEDSDERDLEGIPFNDTQFSW